MPVWLETVGQNLREEEAAQNKSSRIIHKHLLVFSRINYAYAEPDIIRLAKNNDREM